MFGNLTARRKQETLSSNDLDGLVKFVNEKKPKNVVVMVGAGISTAAGIPDFRSPKTGLYHNLASLNLPTPESVFDIEFFRENPRPFYELAHELYPGNFAPTKTHAFLKVLEEKNMLLRVFTQNIDTLERIAGVSDDKVVEAHGSFAGNACIDCKTMFAMDDMKHHVAKKQIANCVDCGGLVKPNIVFFGEALPMRFFLALESDLPKADLCIVIGTSLLVHPFASLPTRIPAKVPRVLMNLEKVGDLGRRGDDVVIIGKCDDVVQQLVDRLGWTEALSETLYSYQTKEPRSVEDEVDEITRHVEKTTLKDSPTESKPKNAPETKSSPVKTEGSLNQPSPSDSNSPASTQKGSDDGIDALPPKKPSAETPPTHLDPVNPNTLMKVPTVEVEVENGTPSKTNSETKANSESSHL